MPPRAPKLVWRFLLADVLRTGALATIALVMVISFAVSVRFLSEGRVELTGALRLMMLATVPMLQYALPFACGFAATLAYHRMASEREDSAAAAGGVAHRSLLTPLIVCGAALGLGLLVMSHQVIPRFLHKMEELVTRDVTGLIKRAIDRGESVRLGNVELFATRATEAGADPSIGAVNRLRLRGVLAADLNAGGDVEGYINADEVNAWLFDDSTGDERITTAVLDFRGASMDSGGDIFRSGRIGTHHIRIRNTFSDDPKYMTYSELRALREHPENLGQVAALGRELRLRLAQQAAVMRLRGSIETGGVAEFERLGGERVTVRAADLDYAGGRWELSAGDGGVLRIDRVLRGTTYRQLASRCWVELDSAPEDRERASVRLRCEGLRLGDEDAPSSDGGAAAAMIGGLSVPGAAGTRETTSDLGPLMARARAASGSDLENEIASAVGRLVQRIADLRREVMSKQHERIAYAAACMLALLCGGVTALRRGAEQALPVYLWSFFPALASIITISAGQNLTHKIGAPGLFLLWSGVAAMGLYIAREFARLARH